MRSNPALFLTMVLALLWSAGALPAQEPKAEHSWIHPPSASLLKKTAGLQHQTIDSKLMNTKVGYSIVLPPGYASHTGQRYPVVYWLHGGGGNETSDVWTSHTWRKTEQVHAITETILVYPNAGRSSYWDHHDKKVMMESFIIEELIPHVDRNFRTRANRTGRAVHGFSMGASGALKFAIRYPNLFCSAVAYGGGAIDLEKTRMPFVTKILDRNLGSDPELIRRNNTYRILEERHADVRKYDVRFRMICGDKDTWKSSAIDFQKELQRYQVDCDLKLVPNASHENGKLVRAEGVAAARFQDKVFRKAKNLQINSNR